MMKEGTVTDKLNTWIMQVMKYKYAVLVLVLGIGLMLLPKDKKNQQTVSETETEYEDIELQLEEILGRIEGAGKVDVMLTLKEGIQYTYQTDDQYYSDSSEQEREARTVLVSNGDGAESAVVTGMKYPVYMGAVVVCEGADQAFVKLSIVNAVSDLTGLGSDKISVIKMNGS